MSADITVVKERLQQAQPKGFTVFCRRHASVYVVYTGCRYFSRVLGKGPTKSAAWDDAIKNNSKTA